MELTHREVSSKGGINKWKKIRSKKARSKIMSKVRTDGLRKLSTGK